MLPKIEGNSGILLFFLSSLALGLLSFLRVAVSLADGLNPLGPSSNLLYLWFISFTKS
jgi:hypothetical protein